MRADGLRMLPSTSSTFDLQLEGNCQDLHPSFGAFLVQCLVIVASGNLPRVTEIAIIHCLARSCQMKRHLIRPKSGFLQWQASTSRTFWSRLQFHGRGLVGEYAATLPDQL